MTLPAAAPIKASDINVELGRSVGAAFDINGASERALAGVPSGDIKFSDFLGKSSSSITQTYSNNSIATSFSSVPFGTDVPGRKIVVLMSHYDRDTAPGVPTCTIGGVPATRLAYDTTGQGSSPFNATGSAIFIAAPSGASGTISTNWGSAGVVIVVLRLTGYSATPTAAAAEAGGGSDGSISIARASGGCVIGLYGSGGGGISGAAWTNITERGDEAGGDDNRRSWAWDIGTSSGSPAVSVSPWSAFVGQNSMALVTLPPA